MLGPAQWDLSFLVISTAICTVEQMTSHSANIHKATMIWVMSKCALKISAYDLMNCLKNISI